MNARPFRLAFALAALLAVGACDNKPPVQRLPEISFADKAPIKLDVAQLIIEPEYRTPARLPNYEHLMPVSPEAATIRWAKDRIKPLGKSGFARVVIKDASVVQTLLKTDKGLTGMFKEEQGERYDGTLDVAIQVLDQRQMPVADIVARATRSRTVPKDVTVNERDRILYEITESLVRDIDAQADGLIRSYFARFIM